MNHRTALLYEIAQPYVDGANICMTFDARAYTSPTRFTYETICADTRIYLLGKTYSSAMADRRLITADPRIRLSILLAAVMIGQHNVLPRERDGERGRARERQRERGAGRERESERGRYTERGRETERERGGGDKDRKREREREREIERKRARSGRCRITTYMWRVAHDLISIGHTLLTNSVFVCVCQCLSLPCRSL